MEQITTPNVLVCCNIKQCVYEWSTHICITVVLHYRVRYNVCDFQNVIFVKVRIKCSCSMKKEVRTMYIIRNTLKNVKNLIYF